ncbi:MAG: S1-C subfamily serine protease, partial [Glaciecola sp.]
DPNEITSEADSNPEATEVVGVTDETDETDGTRQAPEAPEAPEMRATDPLVIEQPEAPPTPVRGFGLRHLLGTAVLSATVAAVVAVPVARTTAQDAIAASTTSAAGTSTPITFESGDSLVAAIAASVSPSVVRIDAASNRGGAIGSGVIYRTDGYVLTNAHVVEGAATFQVTLPDGTELPATLVGADAGSDIAVLQVASQNLPVIAFAESLPSVGETAIAIGSPFGLDGSVTAGVISAVNRQVSTQGGVIGDALQTDAAINSGNSGGALVNSRGELIGINTAILTNTGGNAGIGFAIPVSTARNVADQLINSGTVQQAYLGIRGQTIGPDIAATYDIAADAGVIIAQVDVGTPAEAAGLLQGDLIVGVDGETIDSMADLLAALQRRAPGDVVVLDIMRDRAGSQITVTLGSRTS